MTTYEVMIDNARMQIHCHDEAPPPTNVVIDVPMTQGLRIEYATDGTSSSTSVTPPYVFDNVLHPAPTNNDSDSTYIYPTKWGGMPSSDLSSVPETPGGYELQSVMPIMYAHTEGGAQIDIPEDTSDWGYNPNPTKSPYLIFTHFGGEVLDDIPEGIDPSEPILSGYLSLPLAGGILASPFRWDQYYVGSPTPPYTANPVSIHATNIYMRYTFVPVI